MPQLQRGEAIALTREGERVERVIFVINDRCWPVLHSSLVATGLGYKLRYINHLCDTGRLNAFFAFGHWWVSEKSAMAYPERVSWGDCVMVISS